LIDYLFAQTCYKTAQVKISEDMNIYTSEINNLRLIYVYG